MARVFIRHSVSDYDEWRSAFDADKPSRAIAGLTDIAVLRDTADPTSVWIVAEGERATVEDMIESPDIWFA